MNLNKNYNTHCNNYYATLSKFGKTLAKNFEEDSFQQFPVYKYDKKSLLNVCMYFKYKQLDNNSGLI